MIMVYYIKLSKAPVGGSSYMILIYIIYAMSHLIIYFV